MSDVVAIRPPTLTLLPLPNITPLPLMIQTCPFAERLPSMADALAPVTRFSVMAAPFGCWKLTLPPVPTEKLCQLMSAFWLDCVTTVLFAFGLFTEAAPAAMDAPEGITG